MLEQIETIPQLFPFPVSNTVSKIKVLLVFIIYPLAMGSYFRKALEHRDDVELLVAGPYTGEWIPWMGGMSLPKKYDNPPDIPLPFPPNIGEINYETIKVNLPDGWKPDLIINIDAGLHFKYKPSDGMVVTVGTDPHVLNDFYDTPRKYSDKFYNMQLCYSKANDHYLPYAYSQYDHYPIDGTIGVQPGDSYPNYLESVEYVAKSVDAVLIGMPYEQRVQWVDKLRSRGASVIFENGPVFDEARTLYNRGRIGLNWSSLDDLNARAFELPAMKLAPVMNYVTDIGRFFKDGITYKGFSSLNDAVEAVIWLKDHPVECDIMAYNAYENVKGQHYDARIETILKDCGFV